MVNKLSLLARVVPIAFGLAIVVIAAGMIWLRFYYEFPPLPLCALVC